MVLMKLASAQKSSSNPLSFHDGELLRLFHEHVPTAIRRPEVRRRRRVDKIDLPCLALVADSHPRPPPLLPSPGSTNAPSVVTEQLQLVVGGVALPPAGMGHERKGSKHTKSSQKRHSSSSGKQFEGLRLAGGGVSTRLTSLS
jgi:hypothetical protein